MNKSEALELMRQYTVDLANRRLSQWPTRRHQRGHLLSMTMRFPEDGSERKAMRWLGFMQGALWMAGIFTLEELKEHSRRKHLGDTLP